MLLREIIKKKGGRCDKTFRLSRSQTFGRFKMHCVLLKFIIGNEHSSFALNTLILSPDSSHYPGICITFSISASRFLSSLSARESALRVASRLSGTRGVCFLASQREMYAAHRAASQHSKVLLLQL